jgi:hypothetical protein
VARNATVLQPPATGEIEDRRGDLAAGGFDPRQRVLEGIGLQHDERNGGHGGVTGRQSTVHPGALEPGVGRAVVREGPPEGRGVEGLRRREVTDRKFDVVDALVHAADDGGSARGTPAG